MEYFYACLTVPIAIVLSAVVALSPMRGFLGRYGEVRIWLAMVWIAFIFCASAIGMSFAIAYGVYDYSTGVDSRLTEASIILIRTQRDPLIWEFALRTISSSNGGDFTCRTRPDICVLADEMVKHLPAELWEPVGDSVFVVSMLTAGAAASTLSVVSKFHSGKLSSSPTSVNTL